MTVTYDSIATTTLGSTSSLITFSSIPGTYTDLVLIISGNSSSSSNFYVFKYNSDTGSNYSRTNLIGNGTAASSDRFSNESAGYFVTSTIPTAASTFDACIVNIMNYSNTTTYKTTISRGNTAGTNLGATVGLWRSTSAITRIDISPYNGSFASGSTFSLYGIKAE
jgi:hypothetical protein